MAPTMTRKRLNTEDEVFDLIKSIADIANLTPLELIRLLREPEQPTRTRLPRNTAKPRRRHVKRPKRHPRRRSLPAGWLENDVEKSVCVGLAGFQSVQPTSYVSGCVPSQSEAYPEHRDYVTRLTAVPASSSDLDPQTDHRPLKACSLCPEDADQSVHQEACPPLSDQYSGAPSTLSEYMDFLHPDLAYSNVITVSSE